MRSCWDAKLNDNWFSNPFIVYTALFGRFVVRMAVEFRSEHDKVWEVNVVWSTAMTEHVFWVNTWDDGKLMIIGAE